MVFQSSLRRAAVRTAVAGAVMAGLLAFAPQGAGAVAACPAAAGNPRVARLLYIIVPARCPDSGGLAYWTAALDHGEGSGTAFRKFEGAPGFLSFVVSNRYQRILARTPSASETTYWSKWLNDHDGSLYFEALLAGSHEFFVTMGSSTNIDFITAAYKRLLSRYPDSAAQSYWSNYLAHGGSRLAMTSALVDSNERLRATIQNEYGYVLYRSADAGAVSFWLSHLRPHPDVFALDQVLAASHEFYSLAQTQPNPRV